MLSLWLVPSSIIGLGVEGGGLWVCWCNYYLLSMNKLVELLSSQAIIVTWLTSLQVWPLFAGAFILCFFWPMKSQVQSSLVGLPLFHLINNNLLPSIVVPSSSVGSLLHALLEQSINNQQVFNMMALTLQREDYGHSFFSEHAVKQKQRGCKQHWPMMFLSKMKTQIQHCNKKMYFPEPSVCCVSGIVWTVWWMKEIDVVMCAIGLKVVDSPGARKLADLGSKPPIKGAPIWWMISFFIFTIRHPTTITLTTLFPLVDNPEQGCPNIRQAILNI